MDPLTHLLSGVLVALAVEPARPRPGFVGRLPRLSAGAVAGVLPDFAYLPRIADPLAVLAPTGAWTHSLLALPLLALALAALFAVIARRPAEWPLFLVVTVPALLVHLGLDLMTASGIQPWYPVSDTRHAVPLLFPIDPWLIVTAVIAALVAWRRPKLGRGAAIAAFAGLAGYVALLGQWRDQALALGTAMAARHPSSDTTVHAFPQPFSPRNWQVLVAHGDAFDLAWVKVGTQAAAPAAGQSASGTETGGAGSASATAAVPAGPGLGESGSTRSALVALRHAYADPARVQWTQVFRFGDDGGRAEFARTAWNRPEFGAFRRFSVHTVLSHVEYRADGRQVCAWFHDARYSLPGLVPSYRFGSCQHMDDRTWSVQRAPGPLPLL
ncbi:MAG: metal-dependent hydrolase [Pseudomonadota bacterium]